MNSEPLSPRNELAQQFQPSNSSFAVDILRKAFIARVRQLNVPNSEDLWPVVLERFFNDTKRMMAEVFSNVVLIQLNDREIRFYLNRHSIDRGDRKLLGVKQISRKIIQITERSMMQLSATLKWQIQAHVAYPIRDMLLAHQQTFMSDEAPNVVWMSID